MGDQAFRKMRRHGQQVSQEECRQVLRTEGRCVLSVLGEGGYPYGIPLDFYFDEVRGKVYFHSAREGHKVDALRSNPKACMTTWNTGFKKPGDWAWYVTSVICFGRVRLVEEEDLALDALFQIGKKYYPSAEEARELAQKTLSRVQILELTIDHMTGKLVHES